MLYLSRIHYYARFYTDPVTQCMELSATETRNNKAINNQQ